jgi:hypothetical protein
VIAQPRKEDTLMLYRLIVIIGLVLGLGLGLTSTAAAGPSGPGQPNQSCENMSTLVKTPPGFNTSGFTHATTVYAGAPNTPSLANGNSHAVSQYDVACTVGH